MTLSSVQWECAIFVSLELKFNVFINEKKRQLKVSQSPWLFYYPYPPRKRAERTRENKDEATERLSYLAKVTLLVKDKARFQTQASGSKPALTLLWGLCHPAQALHPMRYGGKER